MTQEDQDRLLRLFNARKVAAAAYAAADNAATEAHQACNKAQAILQQARQNYDKESDRIGRSAEKV